MIKQIIAAGAILLCIFPAVAQNTDKEKADKIFREAIRIMDKGELDASIVLLDSAQKLDPENFVYEYEKGYAAQVKKDYKAAIRYFQAAILYKGANDQCYQMLGNSYDYDGQPEKAMEAYNLGIKKFPNSGRLHVEVGVMAMAQKEYDKAIAAWEKGISVDPGFPSNYYRLAQIYSFSKDRIWTLFYGEMFMNLERNSTRSKEMSKLLFKAYKQSIDITSDSSSKVDFAGPMVISSFDPSKKFKFPFDQVFGLDFIFGMIPATIAGKKEVDIAYLAAARSGFLDRWYDQKRDKEYNNIVIEYQKKIKDSGHFEAYTYWLLRMGDEEEVKTWYAANEEKMTAFIDWVNKNKIEVDSKHYFLRTKVDQ